MGSGKSTVGKVLSERLQLQFIDQDRYIEEAEGQSVPEIFGAKGEIYFRKKEQFYLKEILDLNNHFVLATGGGTPCYGNNMQFILEATPNVFYLKLSIGALVKRLFKEKEGRPLIRHHSEEALPEFIGKHLFERNRYYTMANHTIHCDGHGIDAVVDEILTLLV
jgi:shikimate kinase